jgi:hypothetical protein
MLTKNQKNADKELKMNVGIIVNREIRYMWLLDLLVLKLERGEQVEQNNTGSWITLYLCAQQFTLVLNVLDQL